MASSETAWAGMKPDKQAQFAEKVKAGVARLGVGPEARVTLKLRDKTKLTGYISEAREDAFVVTNAETGRQTAVAYANVAQIKGQNLSSGKRVAIVLGFLVALLVIVAIVLASDKS